MVCQVELHDSSDEEELGTSKFHFNSHMNSHFEHRCPNCDYTSRTEGRLKRHIKDFHSEIPPDSYSGNKAMRQQTETSPTQQQQQQTPTTPGRPKVYRCKQCEFVSTTKVEFWVHAKVHIKDDKVLQCPKCPFVTEYKHHLEYHLRNHFGSKPFKCTKCNYSCVNKSMLNSHMKSHTNVYQYRCADCTYATKYCHSLKLHLRKYNHKPATILNIDGSLPVEDNTSDLLTPRRNAPNQKGQMRKKDKFDGFEGLNIPNPLLPQSPMNMNGMRMPGGLMPSMYWPMLNQVTGGLPPPFPPPLIPSGMGGLGLPKFPGFDFKTPMKCNLCEFSCDSRETMNHHVLKVHAAENQDLFSAFGISSDAILEEQMKKVMEGRDVMPPKSVTPDSSCGGNMPPSSRSPGAWTPVTPRSEMSSESGAPSEMSRRLAELYGQTPQDMSVPNRPDSVESAEKPKQDGNALDLSKPRSAMGMNELAYRAAMHQQQVGSPSSQSGDATAFSRKRRILDGMNASPEPSETITEDSSEPQNLSTTPRKRSRKGKAFKLDTISMRLQEQGADSPSGFESPEEDALMIAERPEDDSEQSRPVSAAEPTPREERRPSIDYSEIHDSLRQLNNESNEKAFPFARPESREKDQRTPPPASSSPGPYSKRDQDSIMSGALINMQRMVNGQGQAPGQGQRNGERRPSLPGQASQMNPDLFAAMMGGFPRMPFGNLPPTSLPANMNMNNAALLSQLAASGRAHGHAISVKGDCFECQYCDIAFKDCVMYTMHMGYHGYQDPLKCNSCGFNAKDKVDFFLHIARVAHV